MLTRAISDDDLKRLAEIYGGVDNIPLNAIDVGEYNRVLKEASKVAPVDFSKANKKDIEEMVLKWQKTKGVGVYRLTVPTSKIKPMGGGLGSGVAGAAGDKFPPPVAFFNKKSGLFELTDGNRRFAFFESSGYSKVPIIVIDPQHALTDQTTLNKALGLTATEIRANKKVAADALKVLINVQQEIKNFVATTQPTMKDGMTIGFNLGRGQIGYIPLSQSQIFDIPAAQQILTKVQLKAASKSLQTSQADLKQVISLSIARGDSAKDLSAAISDKFSLPYMNNRANVTARTEGTGILNAGTQAQYEEDGVKRKKWRATLGDGRTRQTHIDVHHETHDHPIPVDEEFRVGEGYGMYPSDQQLPIKERANCRCALVAADFDEVRCRHYDRLFLREHASYERQLAQSVQVYFKRMKSRVDEKLKKLPHSLIAS